MTEISKEQMVEWLKERISLLRGMEEAKKVVKMLDAILAALIRKDRRYRCSDCGKEWLISEDESGYCMSSLGRDKRVVLADRTEEKGGVSEEERESLLNRIALWRARAERAETEPLVLEASKESFQQIRALILGSRGGVSEEEWKDILEHFIDVCDCSASDRPCEKCDKIKDLIAGNRGGAVTEED